MKCLKLAAFIFTAVVIITACGNDNGKIAEQSNNATTKQFATEAEVAADNDHEINEYPALLMEAITKLYSGKNMDHKTIIYLFDYPELFPAVTAETKKTADKQVNSEITTSHLFENISRYLDTMVEVSGHVVQIKEVEDPDVGITAEIRIIDDNGNSIFGIYSNSTGDILEGDFVTMRGLPTALFSIENIDGGTTHTILLAVSTIQKK